MKYTFGASEPVRYESGLSGFVTETERRAEREERLRIPELSSAFFPHFWLTETNFTVLSYDENGVFVDSAASSENAGVEGLVPLLYRAEVGAAGNYRVTLTIDNSGGEDDELLIFITRRRLYDKVTLRAGEIFVGTYDVNVCEFIPRGYRCEFDVTSIDISVLGRRPRLTSVEVEPLVVENAVPTVWIAGDSTLTDQSCAYPYVPSSSYSGWGQMLSAFLSLGVAVSNHAHSGLTSHTFRAGGHHAIVRRHIKKGDYFLMQFAHNDQKTDFLTAEGGYRDRILEYINEARAVGAYPVIVTPLARNSWRGDGEYNDLLREYDASCKKIGEEYGVPVIGLHDFMMNTVTAEGLCGAKRYFYPGDYTHTNDPGAYMCAKFIARELSVLGGDYSELARLVRIPDYGFDAPSGVKPPEPPADFKVGETKKAAPDESESSPVTRAEAADILIKAAHFFTVNVYNDMFTDIIGHEWYAGAVECAYANGLIPPELAEKGGRFYPDEKITLCDFCVMAALAYASRNTLPKSGKCPFDSKCTDKKRPFIRAAYSLGLISDGDVLSSEVTRLRAQKLSEKLGL